MRLQTPTHLIYNLDMNTDQYKTRLAEETKVLEDELSGLASKSETTTGDWETKAPTDFDSGDADRNVVADAFEAYSENRGVTNELEIRLADVKLAQKKMVEGGYGRCEVCEGEIEEERLQADPAARTCKAHLAEEDSLPRL